MLQVFHQERLKEIRYSKALEKIKCPVLILHGTKSVFSVEGAEAIHRQLVNSELYLFENCGYFEFIESPNQFKKIIRDFYSIK
jgi:pimeloyl-ACP methyl ester carboxylesterase